MKNKIHRTLLAAIMVVAAMPIMAQDYMNVYFKNGDSRKFYLRDVMEITTSKIDANGVNHGEYDYQHVTTKHNQYVYSLNEVDSITFSKIDEELAEQNFVSAMSVVFPAIAGCETIADAECKIDQIKDANGVEAVWSDGHQLYVAINQGEIYSFHINHESNNKVVSVRELPAQVRALADRLKTSVGDQIRGLKAVIANQQHFDESRESYITDYYTPLKEAFEECGIKAHYVANPGVDFFYDNCPYPETASHLNIYDYDLIFLITHGNYSTRIYLNDEDNNFYSYGFKGHSFCTSEELGPVIVSDELTDDDWKNYYNRLRQWRNNNGYSDATDQHIAVGFCHETRNNVRCYVPHPAVTEFFFRDIAPGTFTNPHSVFFNTACQSAMGNNDAERFSLAEEFTKKNLGVYLGYDETNSEGKPSGYSFYCSMMSGKSLLQAYESLTDEQRHDHGTHDDGQPYIANLLIFPQNNTDVQQMFLAPTLTMNVDFKTAMNSFKDNKTIQVTGYTTSTKPDGLVIGFEYDTTESFTSPKKAEDISFVKMNMISENGNVVFHGTLKGLEKGHTYYYRAFTFDGLFHNYGEPRSIAIYDPPTLSETSITLQLGNTGNIQISAGSGDYEAISSNPEVATATVSKLKEGDAVLLIQALKADKTSILVSDTQSGFTATIEVTVTDNSGNLYESCPDSNHPHMIDLGLSDGTKWGCCNVGASKPEEYGDYFAWGETDEKERYKWSTYVYCENGNEWKCYDLGNDIAGTKYDVAHKTWGDEWQIPNYEQLIELKENTTYKLTKINDVYCCKLTGPNGNSIYLPAAGVFDDFRVVYNDWNGEYWTSSNYGGSTAYYFFFTSESGGFMTWGNKNRYYGLSIRPVTNGTPAKFDDLALENISPISLKTGQNTIVNITSGSGSYTATSSDVAIATAEINETKITIQAIAEGTTTITVTDTKSGQGAMIEVNVMQDNTPIDIPAKAIDLGLPSGTLWANMNVGAEKPEDYGLYFAWGETVGYGSDTNDGYSFDWASYKWCEGSDGSDSNIIKYRYKSWIGTSDNLKTLEPEDDAATTYWGDIWRMPTNDEILELLENTNYVWTKQNGVSGGLFTSKINSNSIFIPAAGNRSETYRLSFNNECNIWSSSVYRVYPTYAYHLELGKGYCNSDYGSRCVGFSVRPVTKNTPATYDNLALESTSPISLKTRQYTSVNIISGSGSYNATSSDTDVVKVDISDWTSMTTQEKGKCVNINATGVGTATVTVSDTKTGQTATIEVTVTQNIDVLKLSTYTMSLKVGESKDVVITAFSGSEYIVQTDDVSVATFTSDKDTRTITVTGVGVGNCIVSVYDSGSGESAEVDVTVTAKEPENNFCPDSNHPHMIDLGDGTKWACCNVGASSPEDYGGYYAWGETEEKDKYSWSTYLYCDDGLRENYHNIGGTISHTQYDVAYVKWGGSWQMPNYRQMYFLYNNCSQRTISVNNVLGKEFVGPNGNKIFLPFGGTKGLGSGNMLTDQYGVYWSGEVDDEDGYDSDAYQLQAIDYTNAIFIPTDRCYGCNVRPVYYGDVESYDNLVLKSTSPISLNLGQSRSIKIISGSGNYSALSGNPGVATVVISVTNVIIEAIAVGTTTITVTDVKSGETVSIAVTVSKLGQISADVEAVDLGLPSGTKWANMNVGAEKPEDYGLYFAWGETVGYTSVTSDWHSFNWASYKWCNKSKDTLTKYNTKKGYGMVDGKTELDPEDDAAHVNWGGGWRMPTYKEIKELLYYTTSKRFTLNGVNGRKFTSKINDNFIFLPAAGESDSGDCWSSSLDDWNTNDAVRLESYSGGAYCNTIGRYNGLGVRPVISN